MVARLVRDQEVVGSSPVTSTTKKRRVLPFAFLFLRTRTHDLFLFTGLPKIAAKRDFGEEEERRRTRALPCRSGARKQPTATTRTKRSWNGRCSLQLIFRGVAQFGSAHRIGFPKIAAKRDFGEEEERRRTRALPCRSGARKQPTATTRTKRSWNGRCSLQLIFRGVAQFGSALG